MEELITTVFQSYLGVLGFLLVYLFTVGVAAGLLIEVDEEYGWGNYVIAFLVDSPSGSIFWLTVLALIWPVTFVVWAVVSIAWLLSMVVYFLYLLSKEIPFLFSKKRQW